MGLQIQVRAFISFLRRGKVSLVLFNRESFQVIQSDLFQGLLIRGAEEYLGHNLVALPAPRFKCLLPSACTKTPFTSAFHAWDAAQVVALLGAELKELIGHFCSDAVVPEVRLGDFAEAIAEESGHWRGGEELEWGFKDCINIRDSSESDSVTNVYWRLALGIKLTIEARRSGHGIDGMSLMRTLMQRRIVV